MLGLVAPLRNQTLRPGKAKHSCRVKGNAEAKAVVIVAGQAKPAVPYLQSQGQTDEVHHHLLVGQLHGEEGQQGEDRLEVAGGAVLLLAHQVDVAVQPLGILSQTTHHAGRNKSYKDNDSLLSHA